MYRFKNDYSETAHPDILKALLASASEQNTAYGLDQHCDAAKNTIKKQLNDHSVDIHFFAGGTLTNLTMIAHALKPYQAVIAADSAHINTHETGAIEATGHKVLNTVTADGKLTSELIAAVLAQHPDEHWVQPKMVYISNPTELGTIYTKKELTILSEYCQQQDLLLYLDGARLAVALTAADNDLSFEDLPALLDAFYIGGTKTGALCAEALVIINPALKTHFRFSIKQKGAMLAKGWLLGVQFEALFHNNLYVELGSHINQMASLLKDIFQQANIPFLAKPQTNQLFPVLPKQLANKICARYSVEKIPDTRISTEQICLRFCTSWASTPEMIQQFEQDFQAWIHKDS